MQLKHACVALFLAVAAGLTGCVPPELLEPLDNPPPRERIIVDNYEKYDFISPTKKTTLLNEEFNSNTRGWRVVTSSPDYTMTIAGGELDMFTRSTSQQNTISFSDLKSTDDFEIETAMRIDYSFSQQGCYLLWGGSTTLARQWSFVSLNDEDQSIMVGRMNDDYEIYELGYNNSGYNSIVIRKVKNTYYYFMNGLYLGKKPFVTLDGPKIGFEVPNNTSMSVDYLRVKRLML